MAGNIAYYVIVPYSAEWPRVYEREQRQIRRALGERLAGVEHVGSTSVPGLAAKPIVDVMAGLRSFADAPECIAPLHALGYTVLPEVMRQLGIEDDLLFVKTAPDAVTVNLHLTEFDGTFWQERLMFRELLRSQPELAHEYEEIKRSLAPQFPNGAGYSTAKGPFIEAALREARRRA